METPKIRIGKDFKVEWNIYQRKDGDKTPYMLNAEKGDYVLRLWTPYGKQEITAFEIKDNTISFEFLGKDQKYVGNYSVELIERKDAIGMMTVDTTGFTLVPYSRFESEGGDGSVVIKDVQLEGELALAPMVSVTIDTELSESSLHAIANATVTAELKKKLEAEDLATINGMPLTEGGNIEVVGKTDLDQTLESYVLKERGKQLSQEDFTAALKAKLLSIESEAQKNAPVDDTLSNTSTNAIQNKAVKNYLDAADAEINTLKEQMSKKADAEQINTINGQSMIGGKNITIDVANMTETTYQSLKAMRDAKKLKAGSYYRITDYITKTEAAGTLSAGHPFDVITLALSEDTLSEQAYAIQSKRDTAGYFASCRLDAWRISYALDNDDMRFNWAAPDGTGVIYRMIDEWCNDIPYDFKNIMFVKNGMKQYTFGSAVATLEHPEDNSLMGFSFGNSVQHFHEENDINGYSFSRITFGEYCMYNTVGHGSGEVTFGSECISNTIGISCNNITLGDNSYDNKFSDSCLSITLGANCTSNMFECACSSISLGDRCSYNKYGAGCSKVYVGISATEDRPYTTNVEFASGVNGVRLMRTATASKNDKVQNIVVKRGVSGGTMIVPANNEYELILGRNSAGEVKMYTVEDLIG